MQYLKAEQQPTQYHFEVWMDTAKILEDGKTPDPNYVRIYDWVLNPPEGQTTIQYLANIKNEIAFLVQNELDQIVPTPTSTPLTGF